MLTATGNTKILKLKLLSKILQDILGNYGQGKRIPYHKKENSKTRIAARKFLQKI